MLRIANGLLISFLFLSVPLHSQETLTNESVVKLVKACLGEDLIANMVNSQPGKYSLGAEDIIALKNQGVSDKIIGSMVNRNNAGPSVKPPEVSTTAPPPGPVTEIGVYYKKAEQWVELLPEVVNWKTGGFLKSLATAGLVKGDVNGNINGPHSKNAVRTPVEILIYTPEGVAITEYQLLRLREKDNAREFRTVTGGVLHVSGGATRDLVPFEGKRIATRTFTIILPNLGAGEYGFLSPGAQMSSSAAAQLGKMYTFHILE